MGTLSASMPRFPVPRETLKDFRAAGSEMGEVRDEGGGGVEGESEWESYPGVTEQREETGGDIAEARGEERETTHGGAPEPENQGTSHDPGGSWLAKVRSLLGTRERSAKKPLGKGTGEL
ncbi:hypothetical protein NDU88_006635 [Pleurodeles waltl]|uniref:Uncharacterized protein n=1 Tax=Pleurodeles waltl TaxID=8319 RepID=A0AAV7QPI4_PLEWA|nr:hypothetical protein NDU88_006635 [Pleurodeles waltl]